ncbi:YSIRK-type signal peptide-containing protein, partial [Lactobacillus intestinalis]|uniref:mucin-binding protein n=1 Tax=Lactobacillus intestinalis TaxID=151781 RepID=UPI0026E9A1A5
MVSKNNRIERMEQAAERQSHFGIRKLTIGAASVLLGTTLWLGNNANVAKADTNADKGDIDKANQETANLIQSGAASAEKAVVVANDDSAETAKDKGNDQGATTAIEKTQKAGIQADSSTKNKPSKETKIASNEIEKSDNKKEVVSSQGTTQNKLDVSAAQSPASSVETTADQQKAAQAQVEKGVVNTNNQKQNQTTEQTKAVDQAAKIDQAAQAGQNKSTTHQLDITKAALSGVKDLKADNAVTSLNTSALAKLQEATGDKADEQVTLKSGNVDEATAKKLAQLYGTSLVQTNAPDTSSNKSYTSSQIWDALGKGLQVAGKTMFSPGVISNAINLVNDIIKHPTAENITKDAVALLGAAGAAAFQNALEGKDNPSPTDPSGVRSVSTWEQFVSAVNDDKVNNIQLTNNITGLTALTVDRTNKLTIESAPAKQDANTKDASAVSTPDVTKYSLSMGINPIQVGGLITNPTVEFKNLVINSNNSTGAVQSTNEANTVIFNNVDEHGASLYSGKGNVEIKGNVTSDFNSFTPITKDEFKNEMGTNDTQGVNLNNWYNANIIAKNVIIDDNASLTTTRNQNGHGIVLTGGNNHVGQGTLSVGKNATLNITLKNGTATGAETNMDPEDANTAVWAAHNGNFTTATGAKVVINAGHGRGIVFDEPFGGTRNHQVATPSDWYRNRYDVGQQNESGANNTFKLGDFTDFKMLSRDGILLGNNATMNTGEHSKVSLENYGNGVGLDADAQANIVIGPHTDFEMRSDGKNHSGIWNAGNYIGLGENAQFTVAHDATFRFKLTNAWNGSSLNYADNFNIVSVKRDSNPTVNIENNAIFDGESDYRNIFGEILSFSYNDGPRTSTVNINGARYVNFQRHGATTPGGWQNVVAYDKDGKHSGNLFYSWPANTWNVNGNTYNVYKWSDETESNNTFDSSSYDALVKSIEDLNASSSDYWTNVKNLTMGVNMHRSNLQDMTANTQIGVKQGWNASDKNGKGFDTEFSQRLALVATHIPTEDDKVTDEDGDYNVIIVEDPNLAPGQTQIIQQGKKGRTITVDRTYYNVDLSDPTKPQRTVDTTKGNNGHEIKVVHLGDSQDEIIAVGPQTATVNYVTKDGKAVTGKDGKAIIGTVTASPVETTGANNEIVFNADGTPSAANVNYNESPDLQKAIDAGYIKVAGQASDSTKTAQGLNWDYAISAAGIAQNANKYNITGLTKDAIIKAAESGQTINIAGPVYKVVLEKPEKQNVNITVNYVDDDNNQNVITIGNKTYTDNVNGKPGTPFTYTTQPNIDAITGTGKYRLVANASIPANFPDAPITYTVHFAHVITPVGPNNPDPHGNDGLKKTDLQKTGTKQIHYVLDDGSTTDPSKMTKMVYYDPNITDITDTVTYNGTGYVDAVTGKLVNAKQDANGNWIKDGDADGKITWAPATDADNTYKGAATKVSTGYIADKASVGDETVPTNTDGTPKDGTTEYVIYKTMGKIIPIDKKTGKTITGQPQPQYKNDPTDPTKADPTNPITDIPGYTISNPQTDPNVDPTKKTVTTPTDPTKNTNVEYEQNAKDQKAALKLYDDTAKQWLTIDGTTTTADTDIATATGKPSTDIDFVSGNLDKLASIESLMNKGYAYVATTKGSDPSKNDGYVQLDPMTVMNGVLTKDYSAINAAFGPYDTDDSTTQTFIVHIKHTYTPVNPTNPGNPGQPLNQDPNGPKYPDGTSKADLVKNVTRTITYTVADDPSKAPSPIVENVTFTGQGYLDNVTGKWINVDDNGNILNTPSEGLTWTYVDGNRKDGKGKTYSFNSVPYKDIPGYYVSSITSNYVEGEKSTPSDVDYSDGNGGVKKYDVDASKDLRNLSINVIYTKNKEHMGQVNVVFHDDTTDTTIPNVGHQTGEQKVGDPINYDPKVDQTKLENQGYVYVSTDGTLPADGKIPEGETVVTIHMRHAAVPITPDTPSTDVPSGTPEDALPQHLKVTATRPIEYKLDDGTATDPTQMKDMTGLPSDTIRNQTVVFTGTVYVDKITGQMVHAIADSNSKTGYVVNTNDKSTVAIQWTTTPQDGKFAGFNAPTVDGYNITQNATISERQVVRPSENFIYDTIYVVYKKGAEVKKGSVQVHYHDDTDNTDITEVNGSPIGYNSGEEPEKTPVNYTTTSDLKKLTDAGYVFVSQDKDIPTSISDQNVVVTVHVKHGVQPVNPDTPPKDIPKTPDGKQSVDPNTLTKKINLTVNYVNSDNSQFTATTPANAKQTVTFTGTDYIDKITGKQVNAKQENGQWVIDDSNPAIPQTVWTADKTSFDKVVSPVEQNYHLISVSDYKDGNDVAAISGLTKDSSDITVTVTYAPNGHIIPYYPDPNDPTKSGEKIPNVPSPQYPTDPTDPSKVKPDEPVPNVPGYTPSTPTVTPTDPGKDTPVIYTKPTVNKQTVTIKYIDDVTGDAHTDLSSYDKSITAKPGDDLHYTTKPSINELENKGYVLVHDGFNITTMPETGGTYEVHLNHKTTTITPGKPGTPGEPINPNDPDGPKWPQGTDAKSLTKDGSEIIHYVYSDGTTAAQDSTQTTEFDHTLVFDNVTGKQIEDKRWSPESHKFNDVTSPTIDGYHADKATVEGATVTPDNPTSEITVTYTKNGEEIRNKQTNPASQTVRYVDDQGKQLLDPKSQSFTFTYSGDTYDKETNTLISSGKWNATGHKFNAEDVVEIPGYVAVSGYTYNNGKYTAGGFNASNTGSKDDNNQVFTVVYKKIGKIIPVDPTGNPIPNAPTPTYTNDPTDPTKVTPDEPTPTVPGYTPSTPTVTPSVPTEDTPVPYTPETPAKDQVAIVNYVDADENNKKITDSGNLTGKAGTKIDYSTVSTIQDLENKGYVLVNDGFPAGAVYDNDDNTTQIYTVVLKHGTVPVTPTDPGKPGEPINPNDPDGPKWPDGTGEDSLKKTGTQTIHYVYSDGRKAKDDNVQSFDFTKSGVVDKVTGAIISQTGWNVDSHTFGNVDTPVIDGYHADKRTAGGTTITPEDLTKEVTVTYTPNGKIIPVDPNGKPIPNVPTPQYPTDPTDPTKVVPDEPVPTIPGYTPSTPTVTPTDPGKDTPVPYTPETPAKDQVAIVNYVDADEGNKLITSSGDLTGKAGSKIDYSTKSTIQDLENKGYVLVNDGFPAGAVYDNDDNTTQTYTVVLKHGTVPVTPTNPGKPGEPINPTDPDGPKWPDGTGEDSLKKTGTQTIHYVYSDGRKAKDDNVQSFDFTKSAVVDKVTGAIISQTGWNVDSHTFGNVDTPVIDGYHADKRTAGNTTITPEDLTKEVTVTYTPNGKIIPVDPNGKPIPNVPTPQYPTDPTDPTKVTPDEPVPTIPGMTPSTPTVTPTDPGKDTPVPYTPETPAKDQVAIVNYVDSDEGNKIITTSGNLTGKAGSKIDYSTKSTIQDLENKGYVLVNDGFPAGAVYDNDDNTTQTYTVVLKHGTTTITPDKPGKPGEPINPNDPDGPKFPQGTDENSVKRTGTQTIHYTGAGDKTPKDDVQSFTFTKTMVVDNVTGKVITDGSWNVTSHTFGNVDTPKIDGYHADKRTAGNTTITPDDLNKTVTVNYSPNGKIIPVDPSGKPIPNVPTPTYPTDPSDPTKVTPDEPVPTIPGYTPSTPTVTPTDPGKDTPVPYTPETPAKDQVAIV